MDKKEERIIIIIDDLKFDVTDFLKKHPGGPEIIKKYNGKDATEAFNAIRGHYDGYVDGMLDKMCMGKIEK